MNSSINQLVNTYHNPTYHQLSFTNTQNSQHISNISCISFNTHIKSYSINSVTQFHTFQRQFSSISVKPEKNFEGHYKLLLISN